MGVMCTIRLTCVKFLLKALSEAPKQGLEIDGTDVLYLW